jgi:hypothetical protein
MSKKTQDWFDGLASGRRSQPVEIPKGTALAQPTEAALSDDDYTIRRTGLVIHRRLTFEEWATLYHRIHDIHNASLWALGDALNYGEGEKEWGEKYTQAVEVTGLTVGYLRNVAYVARQVDLSRRNDKLSFHHHRIVAPLEPEEQRDWLTRAFEEGMSVEGLREAIQAALNSKVKVLQEGGQQGDGEGQITILPPGVTQPILGLKAVSDAVEEIYDMILCAEQIDPERRERIGELLTDAQEAIMGALRELDGGECDG